MNEVEEFRVVDFLVLPVERSKHDRYLCIEQAPAAGRKGDYGGSASRCGR